MGETATGFKTSARGFLVELSGVLVYSAQLTSKIEELLAQHGSIASNASGAAISEMQNLDMVRQLQSDIALLLHRFSDSIENDDLDVEQAIDIISQSKLGFVRSALEKSLPIEHRSDTAGLIASSQDTIELF